MDRFFHVYPSAILLSIASAVMGCSPAIGGSSPPAAAVEQGFTHLTFATSRFDNRSVSVQGNFRADTQWYRWNFFGHTLSELDAKLRPDGSIALTSPIYNASIATAVNSNGKVLGRAFGGGGYFEAELSFNSKTVDLKTGWPAWWALSLESLQNSRGSQWKGQPSGFLNTAEVDFFEYLENNNVLGNRYGAGIHHWYGIKGITCGGKGLCDFTPGRNVTVRYAPLGIDWTQYHRYGALWVPATDRKNGSLSFFLDGRQVGEDIIWSKFRDQAPAPAKDKPWSFGILDRQHLVLVLGSGNSSPISVKSVRVWQRNASKNVYLAGAAPYPG